MDTPREEDQAPTTRRIPSFVVKNGMILLALTELGRDIDTILGDGAYKKIVEHLKWNDWYLAWKAARTLAYQHARRSEGDIGTILYQLRQLSLVMKESDNLDVRNLGTYFDEQSH